MQSWPNLENVCNRVRGQAYYLHRQVSSAVSTVAINTPTRSKQWVMFLQEMYSIFHIFIIILLFLLLLSSLVDAKKRKMRKDRHKTLLKCKSCPQWRRMCLTCWERRRWTCRDEAMRQGYLMQVSNSCMITSVLFIVVTHLSVICIMNTRIPLNRVSNYSLEHCADHKQINVHA